jgi:fibronectin type 3 domain-containing protein
MKKLLCTCALYFLLALPAANRLTQAQGEDVIEDVVIEDYDEPAAKISYVTLAWSPNPEQNIGGYIVYYGRASNNYSRLVTVAETTARIGVRGSKTYYFAVTAFDTNGLESDLSEEVHWP